MNKKIILAIIFILILTNAHPRVIVQEVQDSLSKKVVTSYMDSTNQWNLLVPLVNAIKANKIPKPKIKHIEKKLIFTDPKQTSPQWKKLIESRNPDKIKDYVKEESSEKFSIEATQFLFDSLTALKKIIEKPNRFVTNIKKSGKTNPEKLGNSHSDAHNRTESLSKHYWVATAVLITCIIMFTLLSGMLIWTSPRESARKKVLEITKQPINENLKNTKKIDEGKKIGWPDTSSPSLLQMGEKELINTEQPTGIWFTVGASAPGRSHLDSIPMIPCQDDYLIGMIPKTNWGIALISDGAGSSKLSHIAANFAVKKGFSIFQDLMLRSQWATNEAHLPSLIEWELTAKIGLSELNVSLKNFSALNNIEFAEMACTCIVVVYGPAGIMITHIGDGRAAFRDADGMWHPIITPWKDVDGTSTKFINSDIWMDTNKLDNYIESKVIKHPITAFTAMSDGCEEYFFRTGNFDPISKIYRDINEPSASHLEPVLSKIKAETDIGLANEQWKLVLENHPKFSKEKDDKTMIMAYWKNAN